MSALRSEPPQGYTSRSEQRDPQRTYRYFDLVMVAFVVVLVCSNLIGPAKAATLDLPLFGSVTFGAGVVFFPISYVFGDVLTEVYGYARARRAIWSGFAALVFAAVMAAVVVALPPSPHWANQHAYEIAFGNTWRIVLPVTYRVVAFLKEAEGEDYYDRDTNFSPFSI